MELVFSRFERDENYILSPYQLFDSYEVDAELAEKFKQESIDFKHGIPAIDYLIQNWWNPDLGLPISGLISEKEYFFYTVKSISQTYSSKERKCLLLLHEPDNVFKIMKNVKALVSETSNSEAISRDFGLPIDGYMIQKIDKLLVILRTAVENRDLIFCHFSDG